MISDGAAVKSEQQAKAKIFISYSRKDLAFADRLAAALKARGFEPLIDRSEIYAFEEWWQRIEALIIRSDTVVFVLTPDSVSSDVALKEVSFAASVNKRFAPVIRRRVDDKSVPKALAKLNFLFFDDDLRFEESTNRLAEALDTDISWIRQHTEFGEQARRWALAERPSGLLLRSPVLEQSEFWIASRPRGAPVPTEETRAYIGESRQAATRQRIRSRRVRALIYVLLVGIIAGLVGWINQAYVKEQMNWYMTMRPYMLANVRPYVLKPEAERALKPQASFRECAKNCPEMIVVPAGEFTMGSPATEKGRYNNEDPQHKVTDRSSPMRSASTTCPAMCAGLLSGQLQWSVHRWFGVDEWRLQSPCRPRRFLVRRSRVPPLGQPRLEHHRRSELQSRFPAGEDAYALNLYLFTSLPLYILGPEPAPDPDPGGEAPGRFFLAWLR